MSTEITLYHGTCVSQMSEGFQVQNRPFGESSEPHTFVYLCTEPAGAIKAAWRACNKARGRLNDGNLLVSDFVSISPSHAPGPGAYLYKVKVLSNAKIFDWHSKTLSKSDSAQITRTLRTYHSGDRLEYYLRYLWLMLFPDSWKFWVIYAVNNHSSSKHVGGIDRINSFFLNANYDFIKNIELDGDGQNYGEVWSLVLPQTYNRSYKIVEIEPAQTGRRR